MASLVLGHSPFFLSCATLDVSSSFALDHFLLYFFIVVHVPTRRNLPSLPRPQKWKKKRRLGKLLNADGDVIAEEDEDKDFDDERFRDRVGFGEVAQAPPELKKLKKLQHWESRRPAEKGGLLLEGKLQQQGKNKKAKAKKAAVSLAKQDMLDKERERVIEEYRSIKMNKLNKVKM